MNQCSETGLPLGEPRPPLDFAHFPTRWQAVLWRNWGLVTPARLARVLGATEEQVAEAAAAMGLGQGASEEMERRWLKRGYITLIRQNWHLLPYPQLLEMIGKTPKQMAYTLKEDDFLWNKLGRLKPAAEPVSLAPLTGEQARRTREIASLASTAFDESGVPRAERPFDFLEHYGRLAPPEKPRAKDSPFNLRYVYSYSAVYGDPLLDPEVDPYPDGLLSDLAVCGINGVWLQGVLYTLVPWFGESELSEGCEARIENLNALVEKAARHGLGVYLYINEPRAMDPGFYATRPDWKGSFYEATGLNAMCVTGSDDLEKLKAGMRDLFRKAPGLAGVFTITYSENLTHCHSKGQLGEKCPRCKDRSPGEIIAEVNNAIAEGVHAAKPDADVIAWSWAWYEDWWKHAVDNYRTDLRLMCTSESFIPTESMGVEGLVSDYSISRPGPGEFAKEVWNRARERGLDVLAKVQLNNTWECSAVPYIPVPFLVKQHLRNLEAEGVAGLMASWTLGGYPGGNLPLIDREPEELAEEWFGEAAAPKVLGGWKRLGEAFGEFPFHGAACLYTGPQNYGPMNLLYLEPTGYAPTMVGFPHDGLDRWRGNHFPRHVFVEQFRKLSDGWAEGLATLEEAARDVPDAKRANMDDLLSVAEAAYCHFRTTYLQARFIQLRDEGVESSRDELLRILDEEIELAKRLWRIVRRDARIGFEATNHYYYTENTLKEKVLNCESLKARLHQ